MILPPTPKDLSNAPTPSPGGDPPHPDSVQVGPPTRRISPFRARLCAGALLLGSILVLGPLYGCAVGQAADGSAVLGVSLGTHPDANGITVAGTALGSLIGFPQLGVLATAVLGAVGWNRSAKAARSEGRHEGWTEREQAATGVPASPLPASYPPGNPQSPGNPQPIRTDVRSRSSGNL